MYQDINRLSYLEGARSTIDITILRETVLIYGEIDI
jgi:hypothetical protein